MEDASIIETIKETYSKTQNLPDFTQFDAEFELVDSTRRLQFVPVKFTRWIRHVMVDKYFNVINYLYTFVVPNQQSVIYLNEYNYISEELRKEVVDVVRELMLESRTSNHIDFTKDEHEDVAFISASFQKWLELKPRIEKISAANIEGWKKPVTFE
jgi:hypothetical protein